VNLVRLPQAVGYDTGMGVEKEVGGLVLVNLEI